jgi:hypothetical protein
LSGNFSFHAPPNFKIVQAATGTSTRFGQEKDAMAASNDNFALSSPSAFRRKRAHMNAPQATRQDDFVRSSNKPFAD